MSLSRCPKGSFDLAHFNRDLRIHLLIGKGHLITHPPFHFYFPVYSKWRSPPPSPRRSFGADLEIRRHGLSPGGLCSRLPSFYCKAPASWASLSRIPSWAPPPCPPLTASEQSSCAVIQKCHLYAGPPWSLSFCWDHIQRNNSAAEKQWTQRSSTSRVLLTPSVSS